MENDTLTEEQSTTETVEGVPGRADIDTKPSVATAKKAATKEIDESDFSKFLPLDSGVSITSDDSAEDNVNIEKTADKKLVVEDATTTDDEEESAIDKTDAEQESIEQADEETVNEEQPTIATKGKVAVKDRNYEGFTDREKLIFNKAPHSVYEHAVASKKAIVKAEESLKLKDKLITELKSGTVQLPESFYEHEEAFTVLPEYKKSVDVLNSLTSVANYYKQQYVKIKKGEPWEDIYQDPKTGQILKLAAKEPTPEDEINVHERLSSIAAQTQQVHGDINSIKDQFKSKYLETINKIAEIEKTQYGFFEDELAAKIQDGKGKEIILLPAIEKELVDRGIPKTNPLFNLFKKSAALNVMQQLEIRRLKSQTSKQTVLNGERKKAGPTKSAISSGASSSVGKNDITEEHFKKYLR